MRHLRAMLGLLGVATDTPPDPPDDDVEWPTALDATVTALRPIPTYTPLRTLTVNPALSVEGNNYHTIADAMEAAGDIQDSEIQQTSLAPGEFSIYGDARGPEYRVDILVSEGSYDEGNMGTKGWVSLVAVGDKADTIIHTSETGGGTVHVFGPIYMEGFTVVADDAGGGFDTGPKYPLHITSAGPGSTIFVNCDFIVENTAGQWAIGMDAGDSITCLFYRCTITGFDPGEQITNIHSGADVTQPVTVMFVSCTLNGDVNYSALSTSFDHTWFYNNTGGDIVVDGVNVTEHTGSGWPVPTATLSDYAEAFYLPVKVVPSTQVFGTDTTDVNAPDGRTYWVRVQPEKAIHRTHTGIVAADDGGLVGVRSYRGAVPPVSIATTNLPTLVNGNNDVAMYYYDVFYPGDQNHMFIQVDIVSGSPLLKFSTTWSDGSWFSDDGGETVTPCNPDEDPVPVVRLKSVS